MLMLCGGNLPHMSEHSMAIQLPSAEEPDPYVSLTRSRWKDAQGSGYREMGQADSLPHKLEPEQGHFQLPALCNQMGKGSGAIAVPQMRPSYLPASSWETLTYSSWTDIISWRLFLNDRWKQFGEKLLPGSSHG